MAQYSLKDYVAFITQLLECPEGSEWKLLHQYHPLVNAELIQLMEQIARNLLRQGDSRSANFLHHWAQEIEQHLTRNHSPQTGTAMPKRIDVSQNLEQECAQNTKQIAKEPVSDTLPARALQVTQPPLYYLDILEKAQANDWLLTTHELETVLEVKPHCSKAKRDYYHGGWRFHRCGKVGRDALWQVFKLVPEELQNQGTEA